MEWTTATCLHAEQQQLLSSEETPQLQHVRVNGGDDNIHATAVAPLPAACRRVSAALVEQQQQSPHTAS